MKAVVWSKPACAFCEKAKSLLKMKGTAEKKLEALAHAEDKLESLTKL